MFHTASNEKIKKGKVTDVYFNRVVKAINDKGADKHVVAEIRVQTLPRNWQWAVFAGLEEVASLLKGLPIDVIALPEGTIFYPEEPVLVISGNYTDFAIYETAILGLLCQATGIATQAARTKMAAQGTPVYSFGARRMHPAISPMIERSAYIGGCDGVSVATSGDLIKEEAVGTMSHSLMLLFGGEREAFRAFDSSVSHDIKRIALVDTLSDEKVGSLIAAEEFGDDLFAVRIDTPLSRRGDLCKILEEVRWELDARGYEHVKIFVSGGITETDIQNLNIYADAYGVGTSISNAPTVDLSLDIVEVDGEPSSKRGKMSGQKDLMVCQNCLRRKVNLKNAQSNDCICGGTYKSIFKQLLKKGKVAAKLPAPQKIREHVLIQIDSLEFETPL